MRLQLAIFSFLVYRSSTSSCEVVSTSFGKVKGRLYDPSWHGRKYYAYFSIPFAADTSGENRFLPPKPRQPWSGVLDVSDFDRQRERSCIQVDTVTENGLQGQEDCLNLVVYTPKSSCERGRLLPVVVYFHGGSFITGDTRPWDAFRHLDYDMVFVVPDFRLGLLSWFHTHTEDAPGNLALYDQLEALKWVKANIANFGGDPTRITLTGDSAGAVFTGYHILSPLSAGLFQRAYVQAGSPLGYWALENDPLHDYHNLIAQTTNCSRSDTRSFVDCLRNVSPGILIDLQYKFLESERRNNRSGFRGLRPIVQKTKGAFLPIDPLEALQSGRFNKVPTLMGTTKHEGTYVLSVVYHDMLKLKPKEWDRRISPQELAYMGYLGGLLQDAGDVQTLQALTKTFVQPLLEKQQEPSMTLDSILPGLADMFGVGAFKKPMYDFALLMASHNVPVWYYSFEYQGKYTTLDIPKANMVPSGISHNDVLIYLFKQSPELGRADAKFSRFLIKSLYNFYKARGSDSGNPWWPRLTPETEEYVVFAQNSILIRDHYQDSFTVAIEEFLAGNPIPEAYYDETFFKRNQSSRSSSSRL